MPRLHEVLDRVLTGRVAVVSGPPGSDKFRLVSTWLEAHPELSSQWLLHPDELDSAIVGLEQEPPTGPHVLVLGSDEIVACAHQAARIMELAERHSQLRLVFVGRARPSVPLGSIAARGLLVDIDAARLSWQRDEMAAALRVHTPDIDEACLANIWAETRGWPVAGRLLATDPMTTSHQLAVRHTMDHFLDEEVLARLDPEELALLRAVAPLPAVDPGADAWMTGRGEAAALLTRMQSRGVPISWEDGNSIIINPLLRNRLRTALAERDPELAAQTNERAVLWLRHRRQELPAVRLATESGLKELALTIAVEVFVRNLHRPWFGRLLTEMLADLPAGWAHDQFAMVLRSHTAPQTWIAQLQSLNPRWLTRGSLTTRMSLAAMILTVARAAGYPEQTDLQPALQVARDVDSHQVGEIDQALLAALRTEHGLWLLNQGRLRKAQPVLMAALGSARAADVPWAHVACLSGLSFVLALLGSVTEARRLADEACLTAAANEFTTDALVEHALSAQALTAIDVGHPEQARSWIDQLVHHQNLLPENNAIRTWLRAQLDLADDPAGALRLLDAHRDDIRSDTHWGSCLLLGARVEAYIGLGELGLAEQALGTLVQLCTGEDDDGGWQTVSAHLMLARDDFQGAFDLLSPYVQLRATPFPNPKLTLHILMLHGIAADGLHRGHEAMESFQRAQALAERLGLNGPTARHTRTAAAGRLDVALTDAERNVLARLDSERTLSETADALFISLNTVKTHLRRIYRKLGVQSREEAIERARLMGLVK